jgi:hypothetical protein
MNQKNQGFGTVETMVLVFVLGMVGLASWLTWHNMSNRTNQSLASLDSVATYETSLRPGEQPASTSLKLELIDKSTNLPIGNAAVIVTSDNGIRCIQAPCPTDQTSWQGKSNSSGILMVPADAVRSTMHVDIKGYKSASLKHDDKSVRSYRLLLEQ